MLGNSLVDMQIRVFTVGSDGFIKITADELERLLNDAYQEGYNGHSLTIGFPEPQKGEDDACD